LLFQRPLSPRLPMSITANPSSAPRPSGPARLQNSAPCGLRTPAAACRED